MQRINDRSIWAIIINCRQSAKKAPRPVMRGKPPPGRAGRKGLAIVRSIEGGCTASLRINFGEANSAILAVEATNRVTGGMAQTYCHRHEPSPPRSTPPTTNSTNANSTIELGSGTTEGPGVWETPGSRFNSIRLEIKSLG